MSSSFTDLLARTSATLSNGPTVPIPPDGQPAAAASA